MAESNGLIKGLPCGRSGSSISHIFFADGSFLFYKATPSACLAIKEVLSWYKKASGQLVNFSKSTIFFSSHFCLANQESVAGILGDSLVGCHERYLGLPCFTGCNKISLFQSIRDKVWNKLCSWKAKVFLASGREFLIKAVT